MNKSMKRKKCVPHTRHFQCVCTIIYFEILGRKGTIEISEKDQEGVDGYA